jgi:sucrose synthase
MPVGAQDHDKPIIFSMARLDRVKNLTGLAQWYAQSPRLRQLANLVIVGGLVDPDQSNDREEKEECLKMHAIIKEHKLDGEFRSRPDTACSAGFILASLWLASS